MELIRRTDAEIKAYAEGYYDAFERFCECLEVRPLTKAIKKMQADIKKIQRELRRVQT